MPSFRVAAVAAFASLASAQFANTTLPAAVSVPGWTYEGCAVANFPAGALVESSPFNTVERCLLDCSAYTFAFVQGSNCYCASSTNGTTPVADSQCSTRCPGNPTEACGGAAPGMKRQAAGTVVSVYEQLAIVPENIIYTTVINNIYVDYCPEKQALTTVTYPYTATLTGCGCTTTPKPTCPVYTTVYPCTISGTSTVATFTCPSGVTVGTVTAGQSTVTSSAAVSPCPGCYTSAASPVTTKPAQFTGAADSLKVGSGLIAGAAAIAALL